MIQIMLIQVEKVWGISYVVNYITELNEVKLANKVVHGDSTKLSLTLWGNRLTYSRNPESEYGMLSRFYSDTSFNRNDWSLVPALSDSIEYINVYKIETTEANAMDTVLINDMVRIGYNSFFSYIQSNYNDETMISYSETLNDFNTKKIKLFSCEFYIDIPLLLKANTIKVEIKTFTNKNITEINL